MPAPMQETATPNQTNSTKNPDEMTTKKAHQSWWTRHWKKVTASIGVFFILLFTVLGVLGYYTFTVTQDLYDQARVARTNAQVLKDQLTSQNLPAAEVALGELQTNLEDIKVTYSKLAFYKNIPIANRYYLDGEHGIAAAEAGMRAADTTFATVTPFAADLGFTGEDSFTGGTAEQRVELLLKTLDKVSPQLDSITEDLKTAQAEIDKIDPARYPAVVRGIPIRARIVEAQDVADNGIEVLTSFRPVVELLPEMAGSTGERKKYLVLFQNDNELRPTGGFLTAYAVIFIENGKVVPEKSDDIYELDQRFQQRIEIPDALGRYLTTERYWNLRDMNTSPDFKESMETFFSYYKDIDGEPDNIDGIVAVDTHVLTGLLEVVGPIEAPGYGTFSAETDPRCDCPQIIYALSEIITKPTPYIRENRKGILGPLMQSILGKIYTAPQTYMADLFQLGLDSIEGRHAQAYMINPEYQQAIEAVEAAGRQLPPEPEEQKDYLAVVNANLGGAKSNLFVDYEMTQTVEGPVDGRLTKTVEITYRNPEPADNCNLEAGQLCLNSTLRDWTRIYVPQGSTLINAQGFTESPKSYEERGFQVFDGFFTLEPESTAKLILTYEVPYTAQEYALELWKQGGIDPVEIIMDVNGFQEQIVLDSDTTYRTPF